MAPLEPRGGRGDGLALGRSRPAAGGGGRVPPGGRPSPRPSRSADRGVLRGGRSRLRRGNAVLVQVSRRPWAEARGVGWRAGPAARRRGLSSTSRRLQREIRLTQKADYSTAKAPGSPATPRISVRGPAPAPGHASGRAPSPTLDPSLSTHSPGTSGWRTARRCTTTSTRGSRCCAWSGERPHPGLSQLTRAGSAAPILLSYRPVVP
jgi:hypothetical protein